MLTIDFQVWFEMELYMIIFTNDIFYQIQGIPYGIDLNKFEHNELTYLIGFVQEHWSKWNSIVQLLCIS